MRTLISAVVLAGALIVLAHGAVHAAPGGTSSFTGIITGDSEGAYKAWEVVLSPYGPVRLELAWQPCVGGDAITLEVRSPHGVLGESTSTGTCSARAVFSPQGGGKANILLRSTLEDQQIRFALAGTNVDLTVAAHYGPTAYGGEDAVARLKVEHDDPRHHDPYAGDRHDGVHGAHGHPATRHRDPYAAPHHDAHAGVYGAPERHDPYAAGSYTDGALHGRMAHEPPHDPYRAPGYAAPQYGDVTLMGRAYGAPRAYPVHLEAGGRYRVSLPYRSYGYGHGAGMGFTVRGPYGWHTAARASGPGVYEAVFTAPQAGTYTVLVHNHLPGVPMTYSAITVDRMY